MDNKEVILERPDFKTRSNFRSMKEALSSENLFTIINQHPQDIKSSELVDKIRIFDILQGSLSERLRFNPLIPKVFTLYDLREVMANDSTPVFMVPSTASIDRVAVSEICEYYRTVKTIFFEHGLDS